jgi:hypothetical protein
VHGIIYVRQTEIHTVKPLVLEQSAFENELAIEKLKIHVSPGIDQISAEMIKSEGSTIRFRSINVLILFRIVRNYLSSGTSQSL